MTEHKHAWVLRELADGASLDDYEIFTQDGHRCWAGLRFYEKFFLEGRGEIRRKPKMIRINDVEFPEPVREPLKNGVTYFSVAMSLTESVSASVWWADRVDGLRLERGLIHLTEEAARQHAKALILLSGGGV